MNRALAFFANIDWGDVAQASVDTLTMLGWSLGFTVLIGLPLGIVLYLSGQPRLLHAPRLYRLLSLGGQRPAIAAVHHFIDRDDPGDDADYRHFARR
ncbi:ABC transporter permease [Klebsiella michiganensis]|uniref:ABC transporter permease n=1 Tax=Klebsiella michiganensis TaxID=1134687 RepID=A0A7H4PLK5_9ENTR|nr:ABC transporter permease [Klebsiella michiganensis]